MTDAKETTPTVFVSYSYDSREHRQWVLRPGERLIDNGVNVLLDHGPTTAART